MNIINRITKKVKQMTNKTIPYKTSESLNLIRNDKYSQQTLNKKKTIDSLEPNYNSINCRYSGEPTSLERAIGVVLKTSVPSHPQKKLPKVQSNKCYNPKETETIYNIDDILKSKESF